MNDVHVEKIIKRWKHRKRVLCEHKIYCEYLYERYEKNNKITDLIDHNLDDRIDILINLYNVRAKKLKMPTYTQVSILFEIPND